jgi:hypothetical protein
MKMRNPKAQTTIVVIAIAFGFASAFDKKMSEPWVNCYPNRF